MADQPRYSIGDHVGSDAAGLTYYGYIKEIRPYEFGGWEYLVDYYSYALGKVWTVEWRMFPNKNSKEES